MSAMNKYLIQFAQSHEEFRLPELDSLAKLYNVSLKYNIQDYKKDSPFFIVEVASDEAATCLVKRAILIKNIYELWGSGETYDQVHAQVTDSNQTFKFIVKAFGSTCSAEYQLRVINSFSYLGFKGPIDLKNPQVLFSVMEDYGIELNAPLPPDYPCAIYFGRFIASGDRDLIQTYNVKKRNYIGNTTMDAELSLIMANQALAAPGKLVYDPFVGTGSFLVTCAQFGAYTLGSDIDGRQIRGQGNKSIKTNAQQYNVHGRVLDNLVFDICHHPWRENLWFDAIITDPPYGVRAGAKTLGRRHEKKSTKPKTTNELPAHERGNYYPPTKPYEMSEVLVDLLEFAARFLVVGGRLVYWLPTVVEEYTNEDIPKHPSMRLISNSEQTFGVWSRRLITMEKYRENVTGIYHATVNKDYKGLESIYQTGAGIGVGETRNSNGSKLINTNNNGDYIDQDDDQRKPGHYLFRQKYFSSKSQEKSKRE
ncbi:1121_t:CDS:10 [Ambispora gerdemannii]|uniref:tRNA (guanine(10)-N(2))-methyltransferase n=1 Tax=Ambispora gerdemannii TaxID=144530 RepID=A0A9N9AHP8_9GLOM|nr:1121_t:CDS:10 [Ambispora gerdemannii]